MKTIITTLAMICLVGCANTNQGSATKDADDSADAPSADDSGEAASSAPTMTCSTTDGMYTISIAHDDAKIYDANNDLVGSYDHLKEVQSSFSISFGHPNYVDPATGGKDITIALASTNTPFGITAKLNDGTEISYAEAHLSEPGTLTCAN